MASGVYAILDMVTYKRYVGCSSNMDIRWETHTRQLQEKRHPNHLLQQAHNEHPDKFSFIILEYVEPNLMRIREQVWFDRMVRYYDLFNINLRHLPVVSHSTGAT